jgi:predicted transcriptional regulator
MKPIELKMPDEIYRRLENLASQDHQSVNLFASRKLEEFARAVEDFKELERWAQCANREGFESSMARVQKVPPVPGDEANLTSS